MTPLDATALLEAVPDALIAAGADGNILAVNSAAELLLAWRASELLGKPLSTVLPRRAAGRVPALRKDGTEIEVELSLSERGPLLVALLRPLQRADKTASIGTLAASLHEINNPLVYVTLGLELIDRELSRMQKATPLPEDWQRVRAYCADAISGAERVRAIVHELGAFCRPVLPAQPLDDAAAVGVAPRGAARRQRLLLIDDEPHLGTTLSTGLREHADVVAVRSGREAIELLLRDEGFDLILCDLMMPDLTGMDVFEEVSRELPALRGRFVFTTGGAVTERARQFIEEKPDQRLDKPFQLEQVEALLRRPPR